MNRAKKILVVGCGIGGATAAYTLSRAGAQVHCIDSKPVTATAGAGICLLHNAMRALATVGLAEQCLDSGLEFNIHKQFDASGNLLGKNPAPPGCGMRRPELARVLEGSAVAAGAVLEKGLTVTDLVERNDAVEVTLSDGRQEVYDLVVAADGAYSKLRDRVFGSEFKPRFVGQSAWRFNAPRPPEVDGFCLYRTSDGRQTVGALPTSKEACYFFFLEDSAEHLHMADDQLHVLLRERLEAFSAQAIRDSLERVLSPDQVTFRPFDITLVPGPWHRGRVVLLGDAAHTPTPQMTSGGGLAIEDAVVLGECIGREDGVLAALDAYTKRRFERAKTVCDASLELCRLAQQQFSPENAQRGMALMMKTHQYLAQPM